MCEVVAAEAGTRGPHGRRCGERMGRPRWKGRGGWVNTSGNHPLELAVLKALKPVQNSCCQTG